MTDTQVDRRNPNQYQCKHEAEIGQLRAGYDAMAKVLDSMSIKLDLMAGQLNKVAIMEERHDGNLRELAKIAAKIEGFESSISEKFGNEIEKLDTKIETLEDKVTIRHETNKEKLYEAIANVNTKAEENAKLLHKWINWGGGLWAAFMLAAWLLGGAPIESLKQSWNKIENKITNQELVINGIDRRLERLETKK
jgi:archaellum component FlaC